MDKKGLTIEVATPNDKEAIRDLWKAVIEDAFKVDKMDQYHKTEDELTFKMEQLDQAFSHQNAQYFIAKIHDKVVGTIAYSTPPNRGILKRTNNALIDEMEIGSLYIKPNYQKQGLGKILLLFILKQLAQKNFEKVCFDSIIETSKQIWVRMFGEPTYQIESKNHQFTHMIWLVNIKDSINRIDKQLGVNL